MDGDPTVRIECRCGELLTTGRDERAECPECEAVYAVTVTTLQEPGEGGESELPYYENL